MQMAPIFNLFVFVGNIAIYTSILCTNLQIKVATLLLGSRFYPDNF
jgi:hypothetical protein